MTEDVNSGTCNETTRCHTVAAVENKVSKISRHEYVIHNSFI